MAVSTEQLKLLQNSTALRNQLSISIRWRILTSKGGISRIVAYQDARDVQRVLDYVCGPENWSNEPMNLGGKIYMTIGINTEEGWVHKNDVGMETSIASSKGESSDAFKRAGIMWGIFRDVYDFDYIVLKNDGKYPVTPDGVLLKTPVAISAYCNSISRPMQHLRNLYFSIKDELEDNDEIVNNLEQLKNFINDKFV